MMLGSIPAIRLGCQGHHAVAPCVTGLFIYLDCFDYSKIILVIIAVQPITEITHNRPCEAIIFITPGMLLAGGAWCIAVKFKNMKKIVKY